MAGAARAAHPHPPNRWAPPIDVYETGDAYVVTAEVPGVTREDVELAVEESRLVDPGRRAEAPPGAAEAVHYHQVERGHGTFTRSFEFAESIDGDRIAADLADGVLTVTLPKVPPPPPRKIEVR